ncbi:MAG: hypothetical protein HN353_05450 [Bdellovibrionales bacterium]|jgi:hypothetical protein|nr:hypothetical protein [Bdellovibrionales bacterium]MBT3525112.1 hypothetical protein [Bdellovibrionales bacterium]MBT7668530.1 hypothetical protein [Bdellovibrionales bacterium]MBT7765816.1 hypothetical protein [Bdellovibrionales bacterium]
MRRLLLAIPLMIITTLAIGSVTSPIKGEVYRRVHNTCTKQEAGEQELAPEDFSYSEFSNQTNGSKWFTNRTVMKKHFQELYDGDKRLPNRAYFNKDRGEYIIDVMKYGRVQGQIVLPKRFINSISLHIQSALEKKLAEFIFFADMGHAHYHLTKKDFTEKISPLKTKEEVYTELFKLDGLKSLYHTAEKLALKFEEGPLDPIGYRRERYNTRNIVGDNLNLGVIEVLYEFNSSYNTVKDYKEGYREYSSGHYISANKNGCFSYIYNEKTYRFDINLDGIPYHATTDGNL